ncbi:MAG: glycosyltransferase family 2 protein [Candidatus Omnitrophica bacterium]|nr:glycosyltransferase family 2 protein [Candidatus Omnitrophota bacterium]
MISVAVCTYNRSESLRDTLRSLSAQVMTADDSLEVIVVDNNSTDRTAAVVREEAARMRWPLRYVVEPRQGIAFARNLGLQTARGHYVAFIDDDAIADPRWIESLSRGIADTGADLIGGRIDPCWLAPRPTWLTTELCGPITAFDCGPQRHRCTTRCSHAFLTTNVALRRAAVGAYGLFDVSLGRRGTRWVGGEDFELFRRWLRQGAAIVYEPSALVQHKVSPERVTPAFYRRWFEDIGYTQAHQLEAKWHHRLSVMPAWRWKALALAGARYALAQTLGAHGADRRLCAELWWRFERSFLLERLDHWRRRKNCRFSQA